MPRDTHRDRQWIERIQQGDDVAFAELFAAYYPVLCDFASSVAQSKADAEEVVDDVLFSLWERGAENVPPDHVAPYLFASVRNRGNMAIRSHTRRLRREHAYVADNVNDNTNAIVMPHDDHGVSDSEQLLAIYGIVSTLPERCRRIFLLRWTAHLSYAEIARVMDVSEKTVENQLAIAMKRVRERMMNSGQDRDKA